MRVQFILQVYVYRQRLWKKTLNSVAPFYGHFLFTCIRVTCHCWTVNPFHCYFNPFASNAPFLYPPKNIRKLYGFLMFWGVEKGCIGNEWVNQMSKPLRSSSHILRIEKDWEYWWDYSDDLLADLIEKYDTLN